MTGERNAAPACLNRRSADVTQPSRIAISIDAGSAAGALSRRSVFIGLGLLGASALGGCTTAADLAMSPFRSGPARTAPSASPHVPSLEETASIHPDPVVKTIALRSEREMYASFTDNGFTLPAIPIAQLDPKHLRRLVTDPTGEAPGTIVVHLQQRHLYLVQPDGQAIRYGVSIGKEGFVWSGRAEVDHGRKWPTWTPPSEMVARKPKLAKYAHGQPGGLDNPLGARALYIYKDGKDTLFRIHGTPEWKSIGKAASSGCVRMINQDVIDLYARVIDVAKRPIVVVP